MCPLHRASGVVTPPWRQPRGKWMVSLVNSHTNATRIEWHLWEIDLRFAPGLPPGWTHAHHSRVRSDHPRERPADPPSVCRWCNARTSETGTATGCCISWDAWLPSLLLPRYPGLLGGYLIYERNLSLLVRNLSLLGEWLQGQAWNTLPNDPAWHWKEVFHLSECFQVLLHKSTPTQIRQLVHHTSSKERVDRVVW